jgi:hypothetical protein
VADVHKPFVGQRQERVPYGAGFDPLELVDPRASLMVRRMYWALQPDSIRSAYRLHFLHETLCGDWAGDAGMP